jgi:rubredoxin
MQNYIRKKCGYVYNPTLGDPNSGIEPGIPFSSLPDEWVCPQCGAEKSNFKLEDDPASDIPLVEPVS